MAREDAELGIQAAKQIPKIWVASLRSNAGNASVVAFPAGDAVLDIVEVTARSEEVVGACEAEEDAYWEACLAILANGS